jgi:hypothetical protein
MTRRTPAWYWAILVALALFAGYIVYNATAVYGAGLSQDSVVYMAAAENLAAGRGLLSMDGTPITLWPPLYPATLALLLRLFNGDVLVSARVINIVLAVLVVLLTGVYARQLRIGPVFGLGAAAMTAWAYPIVATRIMAWTEPPFVFFVLLSLMALTHYITHRQRGALLLFAIATALAAITRYVGVVLIPIGILVYLAYSQGRWATRLATALALTAIAATPLALVLARNWLVSGTLMGSRHPPSLTLLQNVTATARVATGWFLPASLADDGFVVLIGVLLAQLIGAAVILAYPRIRDTRESVLHLNLPIVLFIIGYVAFLLISTLSTNLNLIDDRYLIPIFAPLMLVVFGSASVIVQALEPKLNRTTLSLVTALGIVLLLIWPLRVTVLSMRHWHDNGEGFISALWDTNETLRYLKDNPAAVADQLIYSNYPHVIFAHLRQETHFVPYHYYVGSTRPMRELPQLQSVWPAGEAVLVWFNWGDWQTYLFRPEELATITQMSEIAVTADGAIWQVLPLP